MERLGISKGSASQGLKFLRTAGAIHMVYVSGDRRMHFEAVAQLRDLITRFLHDQILPQLDSSMTRLGRISGTVKSLPAEDRTRIAARVTLLQTWQKKTRRFLPKVIKLLEG